MKYLNDKNLICILTLAAICILIFCINMSGYNFVDNKETLFVTIAKDMLNNGNWGSIRLGNENFFDLSPLYFWLVNFSCLFFGKISPETVRLPIALTAIAGIFGLYFTIKPILSRIHALIISLMFATSFGIMIYSRLATPDIIFVVCAMSALLFAYSAILLKCNKAKVLFGVYAFTALSVLSGGLMGLIPLIAIIIMHIFSGDLKELIKPKNIIPGLIVFILIVLPRFVFMSFEYGFYEHLKQVFGAYNIFKYSGIKETLEMLCTFILGFSPWIFSFLWVLGYRSKNIYHSIVSYFKDNSQDKLKSKWNKLKRTDKFISLSTIVFFVALIPALLLGAKYTFLVLFLIFPAVCITGHYWYEYIIMIKHRKSIFFATIIPNLIMITFSLIGLFGHNMLNKLLFQGLNHLLIPLIIIFFAIPVMGIFSVIVEGKKVPFAANVILMISLSFVITPNIFNFISMNYGEDDLIKFAALARKDEAPITAYISDKKYSLEYYYDNPVVFIEKQGVKMLSEYIKANPYTYVVVEIKDMFSIEESGMSYILLDAGKIYCLIQYSPKKQIESQNA